MKRAAEHARRLRRLAQQLAKDIGRLRMPPVGDAATELVRAALLGTASEAQSAAAIGRLRRAMEDLNELRVTPVSELTEALSGSLTAPQEGAERILRVLNGVFNRRHSVDLAFLEAMPRRDARRFIDGLDGLDAHGKAMFTLRYLKQRAVPIDARMLDFLRGTETVEPSAPMADVQALIDRVIPPAQIESFYLQLKRHAARTNFPRPKVEVVIPPPSPPPMPVHSGPKPSNAARKPGSRPPAPAAGRGATAPTGRAPSNDGKATAAARPALQKGKPAPTEAARTARPAAKAAPAAPARVAAKPKQKAGPVARPPAPRKARPRKASPRR